MERLCGRRWISSVRLIVSWSLLRTFCRSLTRTESLHFWTLDVENHILHLQCIIISRYLRGIKGYDIRIIGLDLKTDVILHCNELAKKYGYEKLTFLVGDIADYEGVDQVDMVVTLHACDTATDYALAKAVGWNAKVILSVPCCQHEVNKQLEKQRNLHSGKMKSKTEVMEVSEMLGDQLASMEEVLGPIMDYGLLRERFAALVTDGLRAKRLESEGYETQVLEFIDMEHTPKNILLRAVKKGSLAAKSRKEAEDCERFLKIQPTLGMLLAEQKGDK